MEHDLKTFGKEDKKIRTSIFDAVPWRMKIKMNQGEDVVFLFAEFAWEYFLVKRLKMIKLIKPCLLMIVGIPSFY